MTVLLVVLGAAVGAPLRYVTDRLLQGRHDSRFPWGTFAANAGGSAVLGFLVALPASHAAQLLLGTGFCGALTTYSTFSYETLALLRDGSIDAGIANIGGTLLTCIGAAWLGDTVARLL